MVVDTYRNLIAAEVVQVRQITAACLVPGGIGNMEHGATQDGAIDSNSAIQGVSLSIGKPKE